MMPPASYRDVSSFEAGSALCGGIDMDTTAVLHEATATLVHNDITACKKKKLARACC